MSLLTQTSSTQDEKMHSMHCIWVHSWTQLVSIGLLSKSRHSVRRIACAATLLAGSTSPKATVPRALNTPNRPAGFEKPFRLY